MAQNNILFMSATEIAAKIRNKEVTSYDIVSAYLQQIEGQNGIFNAVVLIDKENALRQATLADEAIKTGENLGKLHGVPITHRPSVKGRTSACKSGRSNALN